jgi:hypothetical protein
MAEKKKAANPAQYKYTANFKQPQVVGNVKLAPTGGFLTEREYKTVRRDVYGASLLANGLLVIAGATPAASGEPVPNVDTNGKESGKRK